MKHWQGSKHVGTHTTLIDSAYPIVVFAAGLEEVTGIRPGELKNLAGSSSRSPRLVKMADMDSCIVRLTVLQSGSRQLIFVKSRQLHVTKLTIARFVRDEGYRLKFFSGKDNDD